MTKEIFSEFFERDLLKLKEEISAYKSEEDLWIVRKDISNSAGNLCLHLIGNLNHFIGAALGKTSYVRERDKEFSDKNIPKTELLDAIEKTISVVKKSLQQLNDMDLDKNFPLEKHGKVISTQYMLLHLMAHLSYHLGQINYHRRLLS